MAILAVDDEPLVLRSMVRELEAVFPEDNIINFTSGNKAKEYLLDPHNTTVDYAFLDIKLRGMTGLELAKFVKEVSPRTKIIFCTAYSDYTMEAWQIHAMGYLLKPVTAKAITETLEAMDSAWSNNVISKATDKLLDIKTFGNFEVFKDGHIVAFEREKAKELFAVLVDRNGATISNADIAALLWEDDPYDDSKKAYVRKLISSLNKTFVELNIEDVLVRDTNKTAIDISKVDCDLYRFLDGDAKTVNAYRGEYMINYPWAEFSYSYFV